MLLQLIYVSRVARNVRFEDAEAIAAQSARRNAGEHLTGLLLYTPSHFIQVLEGPEPRVREALARISRDPRHSHIRVLLEGPVSERRFGEWGMKAVWGPSGRGAHELETLRADEALELLHKAV